MVSSDNPRLTDVIHAMPDAAIVLHRDRTVAALNDSFLDEFAADDAYSETIVGARLDQLADSLDATVLEPLNEALGCERLTLHGVLLWQHGAKSGERFDVVISRIDRNHSLVVFSPKVGENSDLGESRRLERLSCLGMAASGVAHDLNNHLAASMNTATLLSDELGASSPHHRALEIIVGSSQEAADLARKLLAFAGRGQPQIHRLDLKKIVEDAALLVRHELPRDGRISFDFAADDSELRGDATQIEHLAMLLLLRTARRLDPSQTASIRTSIVEFSRPQISTYRRRLPFGAYVSLEFRYSLSEVLSSDVLSDDVLATVDAIASEHGGALQFERRGREESAQVLLALARANASAPVPLDSTRLPVRPGRTILVADDDDMVRDVAVAMIRRLGYDPVTASSGAETIASVKKGSPPIDLVLLDLVMGDMDGATALREIRRISPAVKVIVSSGYSTEGSSIAGAQVDAALEKPYTLAALKRTLSVVLG